MRMERAFVYGFEMIAVEELEEIRSSERAWLIDLRDEENYRKGHIKNARNCPLAYIDIWRRELPDRVSIILYCEHGNQSLLAARKLRGRKGAIYTITGGYQAFLKMVKKRLTLMFLTDKIISECI